MVRLGAGRLLANMDSPEKRHVTDFRPGDAARADPVEHADMVLLGEFHMISIEMTSRSIGRRVTPQVALFGAPVR